VEDPKSNVTVEEVDVVDITGNEDVVDGVTVVDDVEDVENTMDGNGPVDVDENRIDASVELAGVDGDEEVGTDVVDEDEVDEEVDDGSTVDEDGARTMVLIVPENSE